MKLLLVILFLISGCASTTLKTDSDVSRSQLLLLPEFMAISMAEDAYRKEIKDAEKEGKGETPEVVAKKAELKKLQEALEPFTKELGRLWDMSKGNWQRVNLDILKRYAELLQRDKALKELAEMLGKMRQAEKEFEEELFAKIQLKNKDSIDNLIDNKIRG